jgi:hypothetical protein
MSKYSEADIAKIINDCEILILPDNSSIEEVLANENQHLLQNSKPKEKEIENHEILEDEETEEDFERIFQKSKLNKHRAPVRRNLVEVKIFSFC